MAHGTPDWGLTAGSQTVYQLTDLAELAARLGSPISHDRRGDAIWWDDFEWGIEKWIRATSGAGGSISASTDEARNGRRSIHLVCGSTLGQYASLTHYQALPVFSPIGFEVSVLFANPISSYRLAITLYDGAVRHNHFLIYDPSAGTLKVTNAAGVDQLVMSDTYLMSVSTLFHTFKLVVDPALSAYRRLIVDSSGYEISSIAALSAPDATAPSMIISLSIVDTSGANGDIYVDDAILTQNEPV